MTDIIQPKEREFNLSEWIMKDKIFDEFGAIPTIKVKEFIGRLKVEIDGHFDFEDIEEIFKIIDKLAGKSLI